MTEFDIHSQIRAESGNGGTQRPHREEKMLFEYGVHIAPPREEVVAKFQGEYEKCRASILEDARFIQGEEERDLEVDALLLEAQRQLLARLVRRSVVHGDPLSWAKYVSLRTVFEFELPLASKAFPQDIAEYVTHIRELEKFTGFTFRILTLHVDGAEGIVIAMQTVVGQGEAYLVASWGSGRIDLPLVQKQARKIKEDRIRDNSGFMTVSILACAVLFAVVFSTSSFPLLAKVVAPIVLFSLLVLAVSAYKRSALRQAQTLE